MHIYVCACNPLLLERHTPFEIAQFTVSFIVESVLAASHTKFVLLLSHFFIFFCYFHFQFSSFLNLSHIYRVSSKPFLFYFAICISSLVFATFCETDKDLKRFFIISRNAAKHVTHNLHSYFYFLSTMYFFTRLLHICG